MKILITGGAGFLGSHLVDLCLERGHEVIVIDSTQNENPPFLDKRAHFYQIDIIDPRVQDIFEKEQPDIVFHLAAQINVTASVKDPIFDARTNILGGLNILSCAKNTGVKKFIFASSGGAIYGESQQIPTPELMDAIPISPYGIAKQAFEEYLDVYGKFYDLPYVSLRFSNIYGPRQVLDSHGRGGVMPIFLKQLLNKGSVTIFGDGSATRDYVFVKDAARAFICAMESDFIGITNISSGIEVSVQELWDLMQNLADLELKTNYAPNRPGEILRSCLDSRRAKEVIDWRPSMSFADGLKETYEWMKQHHY